MRSFRRGRRRYHLRQPCRQRRARCHNQSRQSRLYWAAQRWRLPEQAKSAFRDLRRPAILGIINVTPDSFSDGGAFFSADAAIAHGEMLLEEGADALDIGGESTRPGAIPVTSVEERRRILPVVEGLASRRQGCLIAVDTVKSDVAAAALDAGAGIVNDVSGLRLDGAMGRVCAAARASVILMHSRGTVADMASYTHASYGADPVGEVVSELWDCVARAEAAGIPRENIALDPGLGFSKRSEHSVAVLAELGRVVNMGFPVVVGASRKRFVGELSGVAEPSGRTEGTIAANTMALAAGACIFRVHDVRAARRALDVAWAIAEEMRKQQ